MGTSGAYVPAPKWSGVKTDVTNALNRDLVSGEQAQELVSDFVQQLCQQGEEGFGDVPDDISDVNAIEAKERLQKLLAHLPLVQVRRKGPAGAGGGGGTDSGRTAPKSRSGPRRQRSATGGGRLSGGGSAVRPLAQRLASFISDVPKIGLRQALINAGVARVDDLAPDRIALALADVLASEASLLVQTELREALATVLERVCEQPKTIEAAEQLFSNSAFDLQGVLQMLFECYIMERFKTFFCEHEAAKHGYDAADKILNEARGYVSAEMELEAAERRDLTAVDWAGEDGAKIIDAILVRTIAVYTDT